MEISSTQFGLTNSNEEVTLYTLLNDKGHFVKIMNYGGIITNITVPNKDGQLSNVVLGFDNFDSYKNNDAFLGSICGRFAGRIANGQFTIDDTTYSIPQNDSTNCLHGGIKGFNQKIWSATAKEETNKVSLVLNYLSKDGEEGFPGNYDLTVIYSWDNDDALSIHYTATTDKATVHAPTNHSYFNLSNDLSTNVLEHELMISANEYTEISEISIPVKISNVEGTPFDFKQPKKVGQDISADHPQIKIGNGYDHPFILRTIDNLAATLYCEETGRLMEVYTDQEAVVLYTGNFLDASKIIAGTDGTTKNGGLCLETQYIPNNMNFDAVTTHILRPNETYRSETVFKFSLK